MRIFVVVSSTKVLECTVNTKKKYTIFLCISKEELNFKINKMYILFTIAAKKVVSYKSIKICVGSRC